MTSSEYASTPNPYHLNELRRAFEYIATAEQSTLGAMFMVAAYGEELSVPDSPIRSAEDISELDDPSVGYQRRTDHELNLAFYMPALAQAGLALTNEGFGNPVRLNDAHLFGETLLGASAPDPELAKGADLVSLSLLLKIVDGHVPDILKRDENPLWYKDIHPHHSILTAHCLEGAESLIAGMTHIGADPQIVLSLQYAQAAKAESMLPYWAVAEHWGLYKTSQHNPEWAQWSKDEEFQHLHNFLETVAAHARHGSSFTSTLITTLSQNIKQQIENNRVPVGNHVAREEDEDEDAYGYDAISWHSLGSEEVDKPYDETYEGQLQTILIRLADMQKSLRPE